MTKNAEGVLLKKSKLTTNGKPNLPAPSKLVEGELAINYAEGVETISTKNESGTVVTFSSDDYYTTKKLGSGFTGENSAKTVTDVINQNERITAAALNDLNVNKFDTSAFTVYSGVVETTYVKKADVDQVIDSGTSASTDAVSTSAVYDFVNSHVQPSVNADWDEEDETSPAFILNKPFGDSCEYVTAYENTFIASSIGSDHYGISGFSFSGAGTTFRHGDTYRVTIDEDVYVLNAVYWGGSYLGLNIEEGASSPYTDTWSIFNAGGNAFGSTQIQSGDEVYLKIEQLICTTTLIDNKYVNSSWEKGTGANSVKLINNGGTASGSFSVSEGQNTVASAICAHAEGYMTKANKEDSHAEGNYTLADGSYSHAEGSSTSATSTASHAEGESTLASGNSSHAEGAYTIANGIASHAEGSGTTASENFSHSEGAKTSAIGWAAHTEGSETSATTALAHAEGQFTYANGSPSHAEGQKTSATTVGAHSEGQETLASGHSSHAEGGFTKAGGYYSHAEGCSAYTTAMGGHAEGYQTSATTDSAPGVHAEGHITYANGGGAHAEGFSTSATSMASHAEGYQTITQNMASHAEGFQTSALTQGSHTEGYQTIVIDNTGFGADHAHAEGFSTSATSMASHAEGQNTLASGRSSHAEGENTSATSEASHAEGFYTYAFRKASHAEGQSTQAKGDLGSHAEGNGTIASGISTHAEGHYTEAFGDYSHAEGFQTKALNVSEHSCGQNNISSSASTTFGHSGNTLFSVGNGSNTTPHNAFEIRQNGDIYIVNKAGQDVRLQDEIGNIDVDQDFSNTASTNPISTKAVYSAVTDNELVWTNAFVAISGAISSHTEDTDVHVTLNDKTNWNGKLDATAYTPTDLSNYYQKSETSGTTELSTAFNLKANVSDLNAYFDDAKYEDSGTTKVINFYNGNTIKATIDASDFIVDGMVDDVRIENGNLVIDFNTASGKQDISIPLTDIFNPANYYTTAQTSGASEISTALVSKLDATAYTPTDLSNYYTKSQTSGASEISTALSDKASQSDLETVSGTVTSFTASINDLSGQSETIAAALVDLSENKLDVTAYTPTDLSNYYTKSEIDTMIGNIETLLAAI